MNLTVPENLIAYKSRIICFLSTCTELTEQLKLHNCNLMKYYKEINEIGMSKVILDAKVTVCSVNDLDSNISEFRVHVPFHLRLHYDKFLQRCKLDLEREKKIYFSLENRIVSLLKKMSVSLPEDNNSDSEYQLLDKMEDFDKNISENKIATEPDHDELAIEANYCLNNIEKKVENINKMFVEMSNIVEESLPIVNNIELNVEKADDNITKGTKHLIAASKLKAATIPIATSLGGAFIGGPVGLVLGLKIGLVACGVGAICGFAGGRLISNIQNKENEVSEKKLEQMKKSK